LLGATVPAAITMPIGWSAAAFDFFMDWFLDPPLGLRRERSPQADEWPHATRGCLTQPKCPCCDFRMSLCFKHIRVCGQAVEGTFVPE
jgi:hypothetical protein